jgi:PmbA protein
MTTTKQNLADQARLMTKLADVAMAEAKKLGADQCKVATGASYSRRLNVENKQFALANSLASRSIGILVHKDKKKGSASVNTADERAVKQAVADALALASYSVADPALVLAGPDEAPTARDLPFLWDDALAETELEALQGMMQEALGRVTRDPRVALDKFDMSIDVSWHGLFNSLGVRQQQSQTMAGWSYFGMARDGDEVTGFDYDGSSSFNVTDILPRALADAERFATKVTGFLKPVRCPTYKGPILLTPRAVQEILIGMIMYHASGRSVMDGKSKWDKALGTQVLSPTLTITDHPHDPRFAGATSYDGDGLPTRDHKLVDRGVLNMHLHDCYSAKRTGAKSNAMSGGPFAMAVAGGDKRLDDLRAARNELLVVDRFSGNSDPVKGDFSGVAKGSRLVRGGQDAGAVTETMIAGNFFEFAKTVLGVSRETEMISGSFLAPYILIDGVSVTGS